MPPVRLLILTRPDHPYTYSLNIHMRHRNHPTHTHTHLHNTCHSGASFSHTNTNTQPPHSHKNITKNASFVLSTFCLFCFFLLFFSPSGFRCRCAGMWLLPTLTTSSTTTTTTTTTCASPINPRKNTSKLYSTICNIEWTTPHTTDTKKTLSARFQMTLAWPTDLYTVTRTLRPKNTPPNKQNPTPHWVPNENAMLRSPAHLVGHGPALGGFIDLHTAPPPAQAAQSRMSLFDSCHRKIRMIGGGPAAFFGGLVA